MLKSDKLLETLSQKAGVPVDKLRRLALKELVDNALDSAGSAVIADMRDGRYVIEDEGPGIEGEPEDIARLFSINRPLVSEKLWRRPSRGALGNGLRVVAGALIGSGGGYLVVTTRDKRMEITSLESGGATVTTTPTDMPTGVRIEIAFGPHMPNDQNATRWADMAIAMAETGKHYSGKPNVWHHDADSFYTLTRGAGTRSVREFIAMFDGCTGGKAGEIASEYLNRICDSLTRDEAASLLFAAREAVTNVSHRRLGFVGPNEGFGDHYAKTEGDIRVGSREPFAEIPVVVEAWVDRDDEYNSGVTCFVNRTPIVTDLRIHRDSKKKLAIWGCELRHAIEAPQRGEWNVCVNITTPFMPITSDGKTPNLEHFALTITEAISKAIRKTRGMSTPDGENVNQVGVFLDNLDAAVEKASDGGKFRPSVRDVYYAMRPYFLEALGTEPKYKYFEALIRDYESENGEIEGLYREERGALYHPHTGEEVQLGTLEVGKYERPAWLFNKIVVIEKMGMIEAMRTVGLPERYDFVPMTSRGFTTRALKDILDKLADHNEPLKVFCVTDADAAGSMIYQTLVGETKARAARKIEIINLGLLPWEAESMGLQHEEMEPIKKRRAVADHILAHERRTDHKTWADWLQSNRYELNAMGIPVFLDWLENKLIEHGGATKVVPPVDVIADQAEAYLEKVLREKIREKILRDAGFENLVEKALVATTLPADLLLPEVLSDWLADNDGKHWRRYVQGVVEETVEANQS